MGLHLRKKGAKSLVALVIVVILSLSVSVCAFAYEDYVGVRRSVWPWCSWWTGGYVYINSNTTTQLKLDSLAAWISNDAGSYYPINDRLFNAEGDGYPSNYTTFYAPFPYVMPGNTQRIEAPAGGATFQKVNYGARVGIKTGSSSLGNLVGWDVYYWISGGRTAEFRD